jgi:hypothetical protein
VAAVKMVKPWAIFSLFFSSNLNHCDPALSDEVKILLGGLHRARREFGGKAYSNPYSWDEILKFGFSL